MRIKIAAILAVTAICLAFVLTGLDPAVVAGSLADFHWGGMVGVFVAYAVAHALRVLRWRLILGRPLSFVRLFSVLSIGYLAIHVVPFRMGELVRPYLLAEKEGVPFGAGLAAIFVERLVDMLMLLGMLLLVGFWVDLPAASLVVEGVDVLQAGQRLMGGGVAVGALGLGGLLVIGEPLLRLTDRLPLGGFLRRFREGLLTLAGRPSACGAVLALSVVIWAITVGAVALTLASFPGLPAGPAVALTVWSVTLSGMTVAPTPGFFGAFEAFCSGALMIFGADADRARTFAVILHLGQFLFTIGVGLLFLLLEGLSLREVVGRSRASAVEEAK